MTAARQTDAEVFGSPGGLSFLQTYVTLGGALTNVQARAVCDRLADVEAENERLRSQQPAPRHARIIHAPCPYGHGPA